MDIHVCVCPFWMPFCFVSVYFPGHIAGFSCKKDCHILPGLSILMYAKPTPNTYEKLQNTQGKYN